MLPGLGWRDRISRMRASTVHNGVRRRFFITLLSVYVVSMLVISGISYTILKSYALEGTANVARVFLATLESSREYVGDELRPALTRELPDKFIVEGMSRSYVSRRIAEKVLRDEPEVKFKHASLNPLNPVDRADAFEESVIKDFSVRGTKSWDGIIKREGMDFYVLSRVGEIPDSSCLHCHGNPAMAPREIVDRYGTASGFGVRPGVLIDAMFVYVPMHIPLWYINRSILLFIGLYTVFFALIFIVIDRRFSLIYGELQEGRRRIEEFNQNILDLNHEMEAIVAERTLAMLGLRVADKIRNPLSVIGALTRRLTKCADSELPDKTQEILQQCERIEQSIAEFETLAKNKRYAFKNDDLNAIVTEAAKYLKEAFDAKGVRLELELPQTQIMMKANRRYLLMAINHVLDNALDSTEGGGKVTIKTSLLNNLITLNVTDTGEGIKPEDLAQIYEPFFSTHKQIGLGLTFVRQIVDEHMGRIEIQSTVGQGTVVTLTFPSHWIDSSEAFNNRH